MLDNLDLKQILTDWNYWKTPPPQGIPRMILKQRKIELHPDLIWVIQGVRRSGKSTLLTQIMETQNLDPSSCTFINFEDPRLSNNLNHTLLDQVVSFSKSLIPEFSTRTYFFDEIQNVEQWQKWLHKKMERPSGDRYIITGSNSSLLSGDLASRLTGRHLTLELYPFSFLEFQKIYPNGSLKNYLEQGGFPRVLRLKSEPSVLLREYFTDIIERDVKRNLSSRKGHLISKLVIAVFESTGSELSQRGLAQILGLTTDTLGKYLEACESAYLLFTCPYFSFSERQRTVRNRKIYPIDTGLMYSVSKRGSVEIGKSFETIVFHALKKKYSDISYWCGKHEVDFVVKTPEGILPIQVSWDVPKPRHYEGLKEFKKLYPNTMECLFIDPENFSKLEELLP